MPQLVEAPKPGHVSPLRPFGSRASSPMLLSVTDRPRVASGIILPARWRGKFLLAEACTTPILPTVRVDGMAQAGERSIQEWSATLPFSPMERAIGWGIRMPRRLAELQRLGE
jgi:hypothetical protein